MVEGAGTHEGYVGLDKARSEVRRGLEWVWRPELHRHELAPAKRWWSWQNREGRR